MPEFVARRAFKQFQFNSIVDDKKIKISDGNHQMEVPFKTLCSYSRKVMNDYMQGENIEEYKLKGVSDETFKIFYQLFIKNKVSIEISEDILKEIYQIGIDLEIEDFFDWYSTLIFRDEINLKNIEEVLSFIRKSRKNYNEKLDDIIIFIAKNISEIEPSKLIDLCRIGSENILSNQDFIDKIVSKCEELGYFQDENKVDKVYDFLIALIKDCSYFAYYINKFDAEMIRSSVMNTLLDLTSNESYKKYQNYVLEMQKKINELDGRNPKIVKARYEQYESFLSIICDKIHSNQANDELINRFLDIFQIQNKFDDIYNFLSQRADVKDESTIKVACTIGLSEIVDDQQNTILLSACLKNNYNLVESLINNKCNKTAINKNKDNAVLCTSISGSTKIFDFLIKNGLDAKISNEITGRNAVLTACESGNFEMIKHLVSQGFSLSDLDKENQNCILLAVSSGNWEIIHYLIQNDADPSLHSSNNDLPIFRSVRLGHLEIFQNLLIYCHNFDPNAEDDFLTIAISHQRYKIIKYIIDKKIS